MNCRFCGTVLHRSLIDLGFSSANAGHINRYFVALFLVVAHIAMIFGMLNPHLLMPASAMPM